MADSKNADIKVLIDVLSQGNAHITELEARLYNHQTFSSEACFLLSSKVQSAFAAAIAMTKIIEQRRMLSPPPPPSAAIDGPRSSERSSKEHERREMRRKRKALPTWSGQVQASSAASAMEIRGNDGYSWRKYGQKDILGATFPRCYYRCTHRHSHGCVATKHVQRSENDSTVFDVSYRGAHSCNNGFRKPLLSADEQSTHQNQTQKVKAEALSSMDHKPEPSSSFPFPATPESCVKTESRVFSASNHKFADTICVSNSTASSEMLGLDFGVEQFVFDGEFSFDFY